MSQLAFDQLPYPSRELTVPTSTGSCAMRYLDVGPELPPDHPHPPTLLCVHGNPTWSFYWRAVVEQFHATHRIIAVDHVGCGRSDKPPRTQFSYTLASHRDNLVRLIDALDLNELTLVAHDWGGAIGLSAVLQRMNRLRRIVLLNTGAFPPPYLPLRISACRWPVVGTPAVRGLNLFARAAVKMAMSRSRMKPEVAAGLLAPYDSWENRVAIDSFVRDIPMSNSHPTYAVLQQLESDLPKLAGLPSLLIWGMQDWCFRPECLRRFQSVWPAAETVAIDDAGHYVLEDAPEETLEAIANFLEHASSPSESISPSDLASPSESA